MPGGPGVWSVSGHVEGRWLLGSSLGGGGHGSGGYVGVTRTWRSGGQHPVDEDQAGTWYAESQVEQCEHEELLQTGSSKISEERKMSITDLAGRPPVAASGTSTLVDEMEGVGWKDMAMAGESGVQGW